jgi:hypothetical protein
LYNPIRFDAIQQAKWFKLLKSLGAIRVSGTRGRAFESRIAHHNNIKNLC